MRAEPCIALAMNALRHAESAWILFPVCVGSALQSSVQVAPPGNDNIHDFKQHSDYNTIGAAPHGVNASR